MEKEKLIHVVGTNQDHFAGLKILEILSINLEHLDLIHTKLI
jgi:hypothetical protein